MDHVLQEQMREAKLRQRLRESSIELRNLEAQLRAAYISKELAAQMAEKEAARMKEKRTTLTMDSTISNAGQGKYISFPRPLVVALRNHKRLVQALRTSSNQ